jgi:hypothetical protein
LIRGLLILNSSINGSRDLWWPRDEKATRGYNVYRATDAPVNWVKQNETPIPGQYFRDQTRLQPVRFPVTADNYVDAGEMGMKCVRLPDVPYSEVVKGRPQVATSPDDVFIQCTFPNNVVTNYRPTMVQGADQLVWLPVGKSVPLGGAVSEFPILDFDSVLSIAILYRRLVNYVDIQTNMLRTFYTVIPVGDRGEEHGPGAFGAEVVDSMQVDRLDYMQAEMVRRNQWIFEQVGEPTHLLFRRTAGERCGCNSEFTGGRTACPVCYETGIKGGYYGPIEMLFIDPDAAALRTIDEGGLKVERQSRSYLGRDPIVQDGDLIIRRNGERLVISGVTYKMPRGVLLQQDFNVTLLPPKDVRYLIPIAEPENPVLYNPVTQPDPGNGAQPVVQTDQMPGRDHHTHQVGRTITFGRISS